MDEQFGERGPGVRLALFIDIVVNLLSSYDQRIRALEDNQKAMNDEVTQLTSAEDDLMATIKDRDAKTLAHLNALDAELKAIQTQNGIDLSGQIQRIADMKTQFVSDQDANDAVDPVPAATTSPTTTTTAQPVSGAGQTTASTDASAGEAPAGTPEPSPAVSESSSSVNPPVGDGSTAPAADSASSAAPATDGAVQG